MTDDNDLSQDCFHILKYTTLELKETKGLEDIA